MTTGITRDTWMSCTSGVTRMTGMIRMARMTGMIVMTRITRMVGMTGIAHFKKE